MYAIAAAANDSMLESSRSSPVPPVPAAAVAVPESGTFCDSDTPTAFERKISVLEAGGSDGSTEDSGEPCGEGAACYRLVDMACLQSLVKVLLCPTCQACRLELKESDTGAHLTFVVECPVCGVVASAPLSSTIDGTKQNELAARLGIVSRNCGIGFTKLISFFTELSAPPTMTLKSYQKIATKAHDAVVWASASAMAEAARTVRKTLGTSDGKEQQQDVCIWRRTFDSAKVRPITTFDLASDTTIRLAPPKRSKRSSRAGFMHPASRRLSRFRVRPVRPARLSTSYVIMTFALAGLSLGERFRPSVCRAKLSDTSDARRIADPTSEATKLFGSGSRIARPDVGSDGFFAHSKCQKNFDGSANAMEVQAAGVIFSRPVELHKLQYVIMLCDGDSKAYNHVAELQMYDKDVSKEDCVNHVAKRLYAAALKPAVAKPHRPAFSKDVAKELVPLYNWLTHKDLLARCPKTEFASLQTVETAVALAVLEYNLGPRGFERALLEMKMEAGTHHESQAKKATQHRLARSRASALKSLKVAHKRRIMEAVASKQKRLQEEGPTYAAGLF
ncbi:hypothetical protein HPB47_007060 [Ixodes persulcatus]|uniref:Uncharacterized protein n=1 Tax=Ixodes persulcatus TaxID=34615 RepID=A0AC60P9G6_IXOPE|nr:hypothetical protein HPB47_007060 [Ixodes persulcatus]